MCKYGRGLGLTSCVAIDFLIPVSTLELRVDAKVPSFDMALMQWIDPR